MTYQFCPLCATPLQHVQLKTGEPPRDACPACDFVHYDQPAVAVGGIFQIDGRIALLRRAIEPGYGLWVFERSNGPERDWQDTKGVDQSL